MSSGGTGGIIVRPGLSAAGDASEHNAGVSTAAVSPPESDTSVNCFLFGDKERTRTGGLNDYRFPARDYVPGFPRFTTIDPMCGGTPWLSPYAYCAGNPVMYTDPTGAEIRGQSKDDARKIAEDLNEIFRADEFVGFRELIKVDGKKISAISEMDLNAAFDGIQLSEDQLALVDIVVNTINSKDRHVVEYLKSQGNMSSSAAKALGPELEKLNISVEATSTKYGGLPVFIVSARGGEGLTTPTAHGTYSLLFGDKNLYPRGREVTMGHELFGHGRPLALGRVSQSQQHVDAIQTENLIFRIMGIEYFRDGSDHGNHTIISNPTSLPIFR